MSAITFEALLTREQYLKGLDKKDEWMTVYRMSMLILTRSHKALLESLRKDDGEKTAEAFLDLFDRLDDYLKWRQTETEMLESVRARLMVVLDQFADEVIAKSKGKEGITP